MNEAALRTKIVKALRRYSGWWMVTHGGMYTSRGIPDIMGCYAGRLVGFEVKTPERVHTLTERQARCLADIKRAGGIAAVITSVDDAMGILFGTSPLENRG